MDTTNFEDKELICTCGDPFIWTKGEQHFLNDLLEKGKLDETKDGIVIPGKIIPPKRCKNCRMKRKLEREQKF